MNRRMTQFPRWVQVSASLVIGLFIVLHLKYPSLPIDGITMGLLAFLFVVWFLPYVESFKMPGGVEVKIRDIVGRAEQSLASAKLPAATSGASLAPHKHEVFVGDSIYRELVEQNPNLALAGLRIEIEKRLKQIMRNRKLFVGSRPSISNMIAALRERGTVDPRLASTLSDVVAIGNHAAHGELVDSQTANRGLDIGERLLVVLGDIIELDNMARNA